MKKSNFKLIFIISSILLIVGCIVFYGYRLLHFYKIEHPEVSKDKEVLLYDKLVSYKDLTGSGNGLIEKDAEYYFAGNSKNNYLYFSGMMFRIVGIDKDKNIRLVTDKEVTLLNYGKSTKVTESNVYDWMVNTFTKSLNKDYLQNTKMCVDKINSVDKIKCSIYETNSLVGLLSMDDYKKSGLNKSYLNNNSYFYLSNTNDNNNAWYVYNKGGINSLDSSNQNNYGIRPVITLKNNLSLVSGIGTVEDPFVVEHGTKTNKLSDKTVGEYLMYNSYTFRIIDKDNSKVKVAMEGYIKSGEEDLLINYSKTNNTFSLTNKNNIGYYLNTTFYNSLENKDYIIKSDYYNGSINVYDKENYKTIYNSKVNCNVGLYQIGEMFLNDYSDTLLMTTISNSNDTVYTINKDKLLYETSVKDLKKVRPVLYLDSTLLTSSGSGKIGDPYILSR